MKMTESVRIATEIKAMIIKVEAGTASVFDLIELEEAYETAQNVLNKKIKDYWMECHKRNNSKPMDITVEQAKAIIERN